MEITIKEISSKKDLKAFVKFPSALYAQNEFYVPKLFASELDTLLPDKNPAFKFCKAKYWLALKNNKIVGRIAGIINPNYNEAQKTDYARFGWLDFEEDPQVLELLLKAVEDWALKNSMRYVHGPLGFHSFDNAGVLIEGFDEIPTSFSNYNYPYYPKLIEKSGYKKDVDWVEYSITMPDQIPDKIIKMAKIIKKRYQLQEPELKTTKDLLKYGDGLFDILNQSYKELYAFTKLTRAQTDNLKNHFISFISPEYASIILDSNDHVIGFGIAIPSLSKALQKSKGKLFPFGYYRVWKALRKNDTADLLLIGVKPAYQKKGVHTLIFEKLGQTFLKNKIKHLESTRELENNNAIQNLWSNYIYRQHKRSRCYIKKLTL